MILPPSIGFLITGTVIASLSVIFLASLGAHAVPIDLKNDNFLQPINEQLIKLKGQYVNIQHQIQNQIGKLDDDLHEGVADLVQDVVQEAQTHVRGKIQNQVDKTTGADGLVENLPQTLELPDVFKVGRNIEDIISQQKTDPLQLNPTTQAGNEIQNWHRQFTNQQGESVLGTQAQLKTQQQNQLSQKAADTATSLAQAAQGDHITQEISKKTAIQNALILEVLKQTHGEAQQQNQLAATANLNLNDIAQTLNREQADKQNQTLGAVNVLYTSAVFNNGLWTSSNPNNRNNSSNNQ